ncbi:MAG: hypothetical protein FJY85_02865, partial [Deltaproteobacteria bacterium]|nr:hypothetical protein [Deltaproteobacteria bacterium]
SRLHAAGIEAALMTGSGPTVFGIVDPDQIEEARRKLPSRWYTLVSQPLQRGVAID